MNSIYGSVPLVHGPVASIRVIEILYDAETETPSTISCKFHTLTSEDAKYEALSYTWGSPDTTKVIKLNGEPFEVRQNLWDFLYEARRRGDARPRLIWIDALCINQEDVKEKNYQVAMMGEIYAHAEKVVVWLGSSDPIVPVEHWDGGSQDSTDTEADLDAVAKTLSNTLRDLCERTYWGRLWILQEFVLAKDIDIWCGTRTASIDTFTTLLQDYIDLYSDPATELAQSRVESLLVCRDVNRLPSCRMSFRMLMSHYDFMGCVDVRDRVFAILSLLSESERDELAIKPDYGMTPNELFEDISRTLTKDGEGPITAQDLRALRETLGLETKTETLEKVRASTSSSVTSEALGT